MLLPVLRASSRIVMRHSVVFNCIRLQSNKPERSQQINELKLREIIEGTNFGTEATKKRKLEEERKKLEKEREAERQREEKKEREAKLEEANKQNEADFSSTKTGKLKGEDSEVDHKKDEGLRIENKIIATTDSSVDATDIPNIAEEVNETIQKEIGGLPSEKQKKQSALTKKITQYLDSAHDTILTVTRALNDVTGYSAIERLKKSIEEQEEDLKNAKKYVKECKLTYGDAIQKRSHSQREVNELLTRKHNWSPEDLERFTELYRNDHENDVWEKECEKKLEEAESKVDAVQLKLTQSILTRYHEEQIWSDKIRRSSTWGTWVLMGLNVLLFVFATFLVEPWKRKKLVLGFEDKVKTVLVGIAQENDAVLNPIIEKLDQEQKDGSTGHNLEKSGYLTSEDEGGQTTSLPASLDSTSSQPPSAPVLSKEQQGSRILRAKASIKFFILQAQYAIVSSWHRVRVTCVKSYTALTTPSIEFLKLDKVEFGLYTFIISILSCGLGSLATIYCR
ncbi:sensitivity to high expression protein she9 [Lodderomyces elongisporus]|uniref:sensitivity to high expression protein she9 n=1 Tax=Lodderomyces elongisporus TaxID=36914 RepID=UPI0029270C6C|nr:sensitivity to high expression protein she9 [Lodderomyces elongisporus]WLF77550.1 sensitivity to high expression protein she9 [Lodderomyces elongisporus]